MLYILSSKQLHAKQSKDHDEEEEEEEQADDGLHGVQQRHHQIPQGGPVPEMKIIISMIIYGMSSIKNVF